MKRKAILVLLDEKGGGDPLNENSGLVGALARHCRQILAYGSDFDVRGLRKSGNLCSYVTGGTGGGRGHARGVKLEETDRRAELAQTHDTAHYTAE